MEWIWWMIGLIGVGALVYRWLRRKRGIPLLRAEVSTLNETHYSVQFDRLRSDVASIEYVWFDLCWIAKIVYLVPEGMQSVKARMVESLGQLSSLDRLTQVDVLRILGGASELRISTEQGAGSKYSGVLYFLNVATRFLHTSLPLTVDPQQLPKVAAVLVASSLKHIDPIAMPFLHGGLGQMRQIYKANPALCNEARSTMAVPAAAIRAARADEAYLRLRAESPGV